MSKPVHLCSHICTHVHIFMPVWLGRSLWFFLNVEAALQGEAEVWCLKLCHSAVPPALPSPPCADLGLQDTELMGLSRAGSSSGRLLEQQSSSSMGNDSAAGCTADPTACWLGCGPPASCHPMASGDGNQQGQKHGHYIAILH